MKNCKIWLKMALGLGTIITLIVVLSVLSSSLLGQVDDQLQNITEEYLPQQNIAAKLNDDIKLIPSLMNEYLLSGQNEPYARLGSVFADVRKNFADMEALLAKYPHLNAGRTVQAQASYERLEKTLRDSHDTNETFIGLRASLEAAESGVLKLVEEFVSVQSAVQNKGLEEQNLSELLRVTPLIREANGILDDVNIIRASMLRGLADGNRSYSLDNVSARFPTLLKRVDELAARLIYPKPQEILKQARAGIVDFREVQNKMQTLWAQQEELTKARGPAREEALRLIGEIADTAASLQNKALERVSTAAGNASRVTLIICLVTLLLTLGIGIALTRSITRPVAQALRFAQDVAGGRLDQRLALDRGDEIGQLSVALDSMVDALNEKINDAEKKSQEAEEQSRKALEAMRQAEKAGQEARTKSQAMLVAADKLETVGNVVSSASTQLSAQIEQSDQGASEAAQRLAEAATAMNEMNATVQEVAKNAGAASTASAETKEKAEAGAQVVEKAVQSIGQVHQMSLELKSDMAQLNAHAQDITRIMAVISDIADQTNLLALNAAIEAARAGEAGRGFAVVADEVRKLAEKTMASTNDVGNAIKAIQESTAKSMGGVDQAVERIGEATELAGRSGQALEEIVSTVELTADQVNAIATASEEQSAASEEINHSIVQVNDMAKQTAEAMAEAARAVSDLAAQTQDLTELIRELKAA
ncbi:hypothetical protein HMPREF0326_02758 [Desulfovibrio sp. 3_1_syn3]|uniref:methyl-accepting chemotaxis protein n=1 Tax=Desulfovibrio sp. 3_1_syn3 TaxID=457398 RepID=UPI0002FEF5EF|nr:methyl-accepting chemotaxis protein [Desulfovibrio sp. 3_1_syn3]EFL84895.2 hypothetical protein HMPREF0326_02758 [Desulfovibrio sp. 3_1_syn3]